MATIAETAEPFTPVADLTRTQSLHSLYVDCTRPPLASQVVVAPYRYVENLPCKDFRGILISALNHWLHVPEHSISALKEIIALLHNASLMIDDIQDGSMRRRGHPSTHVVYGVAQTINSGMYHVNEALKRTKQAFGADGVQVFLEQLSVLYTGQGHDIYFSHNMRCPSVGEYLQTIDNKTGALFELAYYLMILKAPLGGNKDHAQRLMTLLGRYYQLRDDYTSIGGGQAEGEALRTKWDDLEAGKYTLPLIHLVQSGYDESVVQHILLSRGPQGKLEPSLMRLLLSCMRRSSLGYTKSVAQEVYQELLAELTIVETVLGQNNPEMRRLIGKLEIA